MSKLGATSFPAPASTLAFSVIPFCLATRAMMLPHPLAGQRNRAPAAEVGQQHLRDHAAAFKVAR